MRINKVDSLHLKNYNNINSKHSNIQNTAYQSFTGLALRLPKTKSTMTTINHQRDVIQSVLQMTSAEVQSLTKDNNLSRINFLHNMATIYNARNYMNYTNNENIMPVINIYKKVRKVQPEHYDLLKELSLPFEKIEQIFTIAENKNPKYIQQVANFYTRIFSQQKAPVSAESFYKIMNSKYSEEIVKNPQKYKSYILLNYKDENFVNNLVKELDEKTFNQALYDKKYNIKSFFSKSFIPETEVLNSHALEDFYSEEGCKLIKNYIKVTRISEQAVLEGNDADILNIYKSTNAKNFELRNSIINNFASRYNEKPSASTQYKIEGKYLSDMFNKLDKDKDAQKFVEHLIKDKYNISIKDLYVILDTIPAKKLNRFYGNVINIESQTEAKKLANVLLKEIENPFYKSFQRQNMEKYGYRAKTPYLMKKILEFKNKINQILYKKFDEPKLTLQEQEMLKGIKPEVIQEKSSFASQMEQISQLPIKRPTQTLKARKLAVKNEVNDFIQKHLTQRMFENQKNTYTENATKLKLGLLPEIFRSISETREVDRIVGKTYGSSSKYDAVKLYQKINRNNKKIINYMLKKRNVDGTRMYDVKSILSFITETEKRFAKAQKSNPQLKTGDIKILYNNRYESLVKHYGKVKPLRSYKTSTKE